MSGAGEHHDDDEKTTVSETDAFDTATRVDVPPVVEPPPDPVDPATAHAQGRVGSTLRDKWRLDVLLGVGGMAAVFAATHRNGSRAAVKILHAELALSPELRTRFMREGYLANSVGHEGVVKVIDDDTAEDGSLFLVTELLDGETLEDRRIRFGGRLPEDDVLSVTDQLLDVLVAAHAKGVVHRDLKPENVFLTRAGQVKVLDFGIARLRQPSSTSTKSTASGITMGTPAFMAPEQARGLWNDVDGRTDLWAVGATMFNLLSGHLVHDGRTPNEQLLSAMTNPAPALETCLPGVSRNVAHVVDRALAFERDKRWPDALRMQEAVRHAYHDRHGAPISTAPRLVVPESVPNRTLASATSGLEARVPKLSTTGQPVFRSGASGQERWRASRTAFGLALLGILTGLGIAAVVRFRGAEARPVSSAAAALAATAVPVVTAALSSPRVGDVPDAAVVPSIAATDLPVAPLARPSPESAPLRPILAPKAAPAPPATATTPAPSATSAAKPTCQPPFVIDPMTGKKKWKTECL